MSEIIPVMLCLRCGYRQQAHGGMRYTIRDRLHMKRCDYTMTIRYLKHRHRLPHPTDSGRAE